ncbi:beta-ketoacyl synthase N-terminal-like domain-containing protein [Paenibacillus sp. L3-i20]|uniref:beta-ketoacyl synthase N-terminal-like domain-containing protein n=1 Tax=Paenibacillus sp. L3-i20 TaxID=2905833 RepID=UPI001EDF045B|nr:beta-ketoacyl synthase N-terminal-like domain-containing protein [Paenibacillus sp. L3-i20]GKU76569.1 hypothetical protein L3i20_v209660 [Paenibacillus sp. L3-i20]
MDKLANLIFEQVAASRLDEKVALELLRTLKQQGDSRTTDIAIIGLSLKMPGATNVEEFWNNVEQGRDCTGPFPVTRQEDSAAFIRTFTQLSEEQIHFSYGGYMQDVDKFDYAFFNLSPKEAALMDPNQRLFLQTAWEAIEDAGYGGRRIQGSNTGVYIGYADWPVYGQYITKNQPAEIPMASTGNTPSIMAGRIAYLLDLQGPALLIDTACSSSLVAVHSACMALRNKECEMAIAGGVKVCLMPVDGLFEIGIESTNRQTSAFDDSSDGTVWGEGSVALLLKPLNQAIRDRDPIHAVIRGSAMNQDGTSVGLTAPNAASQEKLLIRAWQDAGINPETISYIEAHGTGTKLGDPIEVDGMRRAFRNYTNQTQFCAIGSVKTNVGHLDAASGVAGLAKVIAALKYKKLPPTLHFTKPNRSIPFESSPLYVNDRLAEWATDEGVPRRCGVSSFGFSGTNCHLVLEEAPGRLKGLDQDSRDGDGQLIVLSAKSKSSLVRLIQSYVDRLPSLEANLDDLCYTANTGRGQYSYRLALIAGSKSSLLDQLLEVLESGLHSVVEKGIYYDEHRTASSRKDERKRGEWTSEELRARSKASHELILQAVDAGGKLERTQLEQLAQLVVQGAEVDWTLLYEGHIRSKLHIPVYSFEATRCWIDFGANTYHSPTTSVTAANPGESNLIPSSSSNDTSMKHTPRLTGRADGRYSTLEIQISKLWEQLLGVTELDLDDDFFELGGNSILAIRVEVELEQSGIQFSSEQLYQSPTIREIAAYVEQYYSESTSVKAERVEQPDSEQFTLDQAAVASEQHSRTSLVLETNQDLPNHAEVFILPRIEPFNDLYYRNCFYNSFFPVVNHFGGGILPFLLNDLIVFHHSGLEDSSGYELCYREVQPLESLFSQLNLIVQTNYGFDDLTDELIQSIRQGNPVIVWIDIYYVPMRKDAYMKQHVDHTLLIYGYDEQNRLFYMLEHDRRENLSYKPCTIGFDDLVRACQGFQEHYQEMEHRAASYVISHNSDADRWRLDLPELKGIFARNLLNNLHSLNESMEVLKQFVKWIKHISSTEDCLKQNVGMLVDTLNQMLMAKQVEGYRITALYGVDAEILVAHRECVDHWETIRKGIVRFFYVPTYQIDRIEAIHARLDRLLAAEERFLAAMINQLQLTLTHNY